MKKYAMIFCGLLATSQFAYGAEVASADSKEEAAAAITDESVDECVCGGINVFSGFRVGLGVACTQSKGQADYGYDIAINEVTAESVEFAGKLGAATGLQIVPQGNEKILLRSPSMTVGKDMSQKFAGVASLAYYYLVPETSWLFGCQLSASFSNHKKTKGHVSGNLNSEDFFQSTENAEKVRYIGGRLEVELESKAGKFKPSLTLLCGKYLPSVDSMVSIGVGGVFKSYEIGKCKTSDVTPEFSLKFDKNMIDGFMASLQFAYSLQSKKKYKSYTEEINVGHDAYTDDVYVLAPVERKLAVKHGGSYEVRLMLEKGL